MNRYAVQSPLNHNGQHYPTGSVVQLGEILAAPLLAAGVLAAPRPADPTGFTALLAGMDPGDPGQWTRDGRPRTEWLSQQLGRSVSARERDRVWQNLRGGDKS